MKPDYIFIAGTDKSGTTALASWLSSNGLARFVLPGIKEPYTYLSEGTARPLPAELPWLDASVNYAISPHVIARLPEHRTKIVLCVRNPLERAWSSYRMKKIAALGGAVAARMFSDYHQHGGCITDATPAGSHSDAVSLDVLRDITALCFPRASSPHVQRHFQAEAERLRVTTFAARADYEMQFLMTRRAFPFLSMLEGSFYYAALRPLSARYRPEDILLVSLGRLREPQYRETFLRRLIGHAPATEPVPFVFSSRELAFDEPVPDFAAPALQALRGALAYDFRQSTELIAAQGIDDDLLDMDDMRRHLL
ncbi:hypothetical protein HDC36_000725 [Xanthomonas sp. JAI131]|uniref:sulfotransferase domain-containing protein n=1 Tax=Xanthomonas sp. JAI131 TaxID=2723067 RepID=UPI0015C7FEB1|nr:sulfotransferase domain-containing protein [Xanthomonas sp. JAI131]NYF19288.1 hypothetical protein [Xanthomonas sp. JAI131]